MNESVASAGGVQDVRPVIATSNPGNWGAIVFAGVLAVGGFMIYSALSASEDAAEVPSVFAPEGRSGAQIASPAPLQTPPRLQTTTRSRMPPDEALAPAVLRIEPPFVPRIVSPAPTLPAQPLQPEPVPPPEPQRPHGPQIVYEAPQRAEPTGARPRETEADARVSARRLRNPSRTIPQGTVIPAVLETALDSTRAGGVRALIQRDVSSFDGTRVLVPRGSRLYGQYEANLQPGQKRALVQWTRLIRPDGVTIALDSPSSDPLGRAGIEGDVDGKFWQRFGGALLNSVLDVGVGLAVNQATDGVIVALPGSTQNVQVADTQSIQPTLKVKHGTSVSVFVARDLDFSSVDP